jgi:hypothetical protein
MAVTPIPPQAFDPLLLKPMPSSLTPKLKLILDATTSTVAHRPCECLATLLADDHPEFLRDVLPLLSDVYDIVGAVEEGLALVNATMALKPDLIIS